MNGKNVKIEVTKSSDESGTLIDFIKSTKKGKYTKTPPELKGIEYVRLDTSKLEIDESYDELILFGISS